MTTDTTPTFTDLGVPAVIADALTRDGITAPFPIQTDTLPDTLAGKDVLGRGKTGSGKTLAFSIPLATRLADGTRSAPRRPRGLVLAPTRELATQIAKTLTPLAKAQKLSVTTIFGGVSQNRQVEALRRGIDIVVACPGRLEDLVGQGEVDLSDVRIAVLDEADHMADLGFLPGVTRILRATDPAGQRLLFSATLDSQVQKLVDRFLTDPVEHSVDSAQSPVAAMTHHVYEVADGGAKKELIRRLAAGNGRRILFMRTKHKAKRLAQQLTKAGIPAVDLHGNLSQNARDRNLKAFSSGEAMVLVATDIAARGVHVDDVELVVHVDPPAEHKAFLHRSGRTARAGSGGDVVTIVLPEERRDVESMLRKAKISVRPQRVQPATAPVPGGSGDAPVAPRRAPAADTAAPAQPREGRPGGQGGDRDGRPARSRNRNRNRRRGGAGRSGAGAPRTEGGPTAAPVGAQPGAGRRTGASAPAAARASVGATAGPQRRQRRRSSRGAGAPQA